MAVNGRRTFLGHFVICLACAGAAFFAWTRGVPQMVYANDLSMMTSVIAVLLIGASIHIGRQAWTVDNSPLAVDVEDGHEAQELVVMAGLLGTALGLSMQAVALATNGSASFSALATALYTTACGVGASAILKIMTRNLEKGIRRAAQ